MTRVVAACRRAWRAGVAYGTLLLALLGVPDPGAAQGGEWPTLRDAGLEYLSESGFLQVGLAGQLDLEALSVGHGRWAGLVGGESVDSVPADWTTACADCHQQENVAQHGKGGEILAHRLRVFTDVFVGEHVYSLLEVRSDRGHAPARGYIRARIEQAYVRVANARGSAGVQVGRFASPFGAYALRHLTTADPFLRPPLAYDYRTVMNRSHAPGAAAGFLTWKEWPELFRFSGVPPVWDVPYQWGAMVFGRVASVELRAAALNSAPSSAPRAWGFSLDRLEHPSWVLAARTRLTPSIEIGGSYDRGPWLEEIATGTIQAFGASRWDFDQELISADIQLARGRTTARAEVVMDRWEVPNIAERLVEIAYAAEVQTDLSAGMSVAVRWGLIDFRALDAGAAGPADWDYDVMRWEASLGYRLVRNGGVMLAGYWQDPRHGPDTLLSGLRAWWAF